MCHCPEKSRVTAFFYPHNFKVVYSFSEVVSLVFVYINCNSQSPKRGFNFVVIAVVFLKIFPILLTNQGGQKDVNKVSKDFRRTALRKNTKLSEQYLDWNRMSNGIMAYLNP